MNPLSFIPRAEAHAWQRRVAALLLSCTAALGAAPTAAAQVTQYWVNPQSGVDPGIPGNPNAPYKTLRYTVSVAAAPAIIHALPGIYSDDPVVGNGELFPIVMRDEVHLQGIGAKECVIRNTKTTSTPSQQFVPTIINPGVVAVHKILDCNFLGEFETSVEGFTFQGADVQIGTWAESAQSARISNCVFDLRGGGEDSLPAPEFGILLSPIWDWHPDVPLYNPLTYHIFNNTFLQGYRRNAEGAVENASPSSVALCNVGDPAEWGPIGFEDDAPLHGPSALNVQNNLFRHLLGAKRTSMLGIDANDTSVRSTPTPGGTQVGPTNAFDPDTVGGSNSTYVSGIGPPAAPPVPKVIINRSAGVGIDPGFIGEMISQVQAATLANPLVRDWRLLPDSALVDQGSAPLYVGVMGIFRATNGVTYVDNKNSPISSFDWDGEGHGNRRWVADHPDIGYDETDLLEVAGCYGNDSKSHDQPFDPTIRAGNPWRTMILPQTGIVQIWYTTRSYVPGVGWTRSPGTVPGTTTPNGVNYLHPPTTVILNIPAPVLNSWTNPVDNNVHTWAEALLFSPDGGAPALHLNQQILFAPTGGGSPTLSNLQFEIF